MDNLNQPNFNSAPVLPPRRYSRAIALSVIGVIITAGFLFYTGGFSALSNIFGSKAGTEIIFAGASNLQGAVEADEWVLGETHPPVLTGTSVFSSFTGVPDYILSEASQPGFVAPLITSVEADEPTITKNEYTSSALDLGAGAAELTQLTAYLYLPTDTDQTVIAYRTAEELDSLTTASFITLNDTPTMLPINESIKTITSELVPGSLSRYLQLQVNFVSFNPENRPAFYGVMIEVPTSDTTRGDIPEEGLDENADVRINLTFDDGPATPDQARIQVFSDDLTEGAIYTANDVNLRLAEEQKYTIATDLTPNAAHAVVITSPTTSPKVMPFYGIGSGALTFALGAFEPAAGGQLQPTLPESTPSSQPSADLNGDGAVNALDYSIFLSQFQP